MASGGGKGGYMAPLPSAAASDMPPLRSRAGGGKGKGHLHIAAPVEEEDPYEN